jgi:hypothetical protein
MPRVTTIPEAVPDQSRRSLPDQSRRWNLQAITTGLGASRLRYTLYLYVASRLLFLAIAGFDALTQHQSLASQMGNWDGVWYLRTAALWYQHTVPTHDKDYRDIGFMPLYPMLIWLVAHVTQLGNFGAGIAISLVSGASATVLIGKLAEQWWGELAARRAILFWCFFPGTIVFSMAYSEGVTLTLVAGCLLLLKQKRWLAAGLCAGFATAIAPVALAVVPVCLFASWQEIRARGWTDRAARRSLVAPILSPFGAIGFGIFLWLWAGSPFADYTAQHVAWSEHSTPLAIPKLVGSLIRQIFIDPLPHRHGPQGIDLNGILALLGTAFLVWGARILWRHRERVPVTALIWTGCVAFLTLTSSGTPPNPRMLVVMFPVVMAVGAQLPERLYKRAMIINIVATLVMSYFTYVGMWLRP